MRVSASVVLALLPMWLPFLGESRAAEISGIPPETVTDYIHAVIESDRTFYTVHVVERLQKDGSAVASEQWRGKKNTLPLPAQFLMETSDLATKAGTRLRYRLISLWPINPQNGPRSEQERSGLKALMTQPDRTVTGTVKEGDETYFQAIYADHAVSQSCIGCHNAHPKSPKRDFRLNDAMGGLVIEIPIGR